MDMDLDQIRELLKVVAESDVAEVTIEEDDFKVTVRKNQAEITMQPSSYYPAPMPMPVQGGGASPAAGAPAQPVQGAAAGGGSGRAQAPGAGGSGAQAEASEAAEGEGEDEERADSEEVVTAPLVGTFYRRPSPDEDPFVETGTTVEPGQTLCIIEAMKIMNEIDAEFGGTVREVLVDDGEPVEYDQPLFVIETA